MAGQKRSRKKKQKYPLELIGIVLIFLQILAIGRFGLVGRIIADILRLFVGETYMLVSGLLIVLGGYYILNGSGPDLKGAKRFFGLIMLYLAVLIALHLRLFAPIMDTDVNIIVATFRYFQIDLKTRAVTQNLGGGMIGAVLYSLSHLLFANIGTYIFIFLFIFVGIMMVGNFSYRHLFTNMSKGLKFIGQKIATEFKAFIKATREKIAENREKNQKQESQKPGSQSPKESEKEEVVRQKPKIVGPSRIPTEPVDTEQITMDLPDLAEDAEETDDGEEISINFEMDESEDDYELPPTSILSPAEVVDQSGEYEIIEKNIKVLEETFASFGVDAQVVKANLGPAVTKYEIQPATGVKVSKIVSLSDDLALALAAKDIRLEAPIPGKSLIGIEVPNSEIGTVHFRDVYENMPPEAADHLLEVPLGRDISGRVATADLSKMPHLLVAGATGSGKSVAINSMITSLLLKTKPHQVRLMLIDPKKVELSIYDGIPHLLTPVVTNPKKAARALHNVVEQMEERYELFAASGTRNLESYNDFLRKRRAQGEDTPALLPYIVVIVDELADLMMVASKDVEDAIIRLAQMARAAGIHMVLATQRPSVDVITGLIKANVPSRMAFAVSSGTDSRTILDANGAEKLLGRGDMLFEPMGANKPSRIQGAYISDDDVQKVADYVRAQQEANYVEEMIPKEESGPSASEDLDEYFDDAVEMIRSMDTISISLLQRQFRIGYNRAARLMDDLEAHGLVSPQEGPKPRDVLIDEIPVDEDDEISQDGKNLN